MRKVARAPGEALADFHIFKLVADYWGCGEMFRQWESPEAVFPVTQAALGRSAVRHHGHRELRDARPMRRHPMAVSGK